MEAIEHTNKIYGAFPRKGKWSVKKRPLISKKVDRKKKDKRQTLSSFQSHRNKNSYLAEEVLKKNHYRLRKIRRSKPGPKYWHWGCYGNAYPCMGCALSAPVFGSHLPPSDKAIQCPTCMGWVYRLDENTLDVKGCECIEEDSDSD